MLRNTKFALEHRYESTRKELNEQLDKARSEHHEVSESLKETNVKFENAKKTYEDTIEKEMKEAQTSSNRRAERLENEMERSSERSRYEIRNLKRNEEVRTLFYIFDYKDYNTHLITGRKSPCRETERTLGKESRCDKPIGGEAVHHGVNALHTDEFDVQIESRKLRESHIASGTLVGETEKYASRTRSGVK